VDVATRRLHIRDLRAGDLTAMIELWTDTDVGRFMGTYGPRSAEATATWLEDTMRRAHSARTASELDHGGMTCGWPDEQAGAGSCGSCARTCQSVRSRHQ
jgi:hypothetical protein